MCSTPARCGSCRFASGAGPGRSCLAGAGYLRQLHQDRTLIEHGQIFYAGGGLRYWLRGGDGMTVARSACAPTRARRGGGTGSTSTIEPGRFRPSPARSSSLAPRRSEAICSSSLVPSWLHRDREAAETMARLRFSSRTSARVEAAAVCCTTCRCRSTPAKPSPSSDAAAPARPRCCGSSTACSIPIAGASHVDGRDTREWDPIALRRRTGYVIQDVGLFPHLTVADNIATVPRLLDWPEPRVQARVDELLAMVGLEPARVPRAAGPINCRADSGSGSGWPGPWPPIRRWC